MRVIVAPAFVVETVAELALSMRTPLHLPPVNVAPPVSSIRYWPCAFVVAVSVSPAVNVPPHALPTKEAVNWESLSGMAPMMVVPPTVKAREQIILSGLPHAACSRRSSIGDLGWTGRACSTMSRVGRYERGTYVLCVRLGAGSAHGCAHCTMQRGNCMHAESPMRLRCVPFLRRSIVDVQPRLTARAHCARGELGSCLSRARVFNSEPARRHAAHIRALPSQCTYQPIRPLRHRWTDLRHHEWRLERVRHSTP